MTARTISFDSAARHHIALGLDALAGAVKVTLGPRGRNVMLERAPGAPLVTKDGVTVAKDVELADHSANLGVQLMREVAAHTSTQAGDGTTTATVLAQAIYGAGARLVAAGLDPQELKHGIDAAVLAVVEDLRRQARPITTPREIAQIGTVSANGDAAIGELIARAMDLVGKDGVVTIAEAPSIETLLETVVGMRVDRGYLSAYFITDTEAMTAVLTDARVLLFEERISSLTDFLPLLERVAADGRPLLVVADDVDREALSTLVVNRLRGTLKVCAIKAPGFGATRRALLGDLAAVTGAVAFTADLGRSLASVTLAELGEAKTITVERDHTTFVNGGGGRPALEARAEQLRRELADATDDHARTALEARIARLLGGIAILQIGAATESALAEKKARVEDAVRATRAAVEEGVVAGGGVALMRAIPALDALELSPERARGVGIVRRALEAPLRQIAENGGAEGAVVAAQVRAGTGAYGYNAATEQYEDLIAAGVIDPVKVVRVALQNAASVAALMLTTAAVIAHDDDGGAA